MTSRSIARAAYIAAAALSFTACDVPTTAPIVEQTWVLPVDGASLAASDFLPSGVSVVGGVFAIALPSVALSQSLGQMCPSCPPVSITAPTPAFSAQLDASVALPTDVASATITSGTVLLELDNGLGFDPLRPSQGGARGRIISTLSSGGATLAADTIDGSAASMTPGTTLARVIRITPTTANGPLDVRVTIQSPAGDAASFSTAQRITVRATPRDWRVSTARVALHNKSIRASDVALDLGGVDDALVRRVQSGTLVLHIDNGFNASGSFAVDIAAPGRSTITKPLTLTANSSGTQRLAFTADELRSILGQDGVRLTLRGTASGMDLNGTMLVTPTQSLVISSTLELTLRTEP